MQLQMLNFASICHWTQQGLRIFLIKNIPNGFKPPNLAIFFLTKYTTIHNCYFRTNLSAISRGTIALIKFRLSSPFQLSLKHFFTVQTTVYASQTIFFSVISLTSIHMDLNGLKTLSL